MKKKNPSILLTVFFLAQAIPLQQGFSAKPPLSLNPAIAVNIPALNHTYRQARIEAGKAVAFKVLPDVKYILKDCRVEPRSAYPGREVERSL